MWRFPKLPFYAKFGAIPESYLIALSYEEQILWLCHQMSEFDEKLAKYFEDVKAYVEEVLENLDVELDKKQDKLTAGENIVIDENNVISAIVDPITYKYTPINGSYYNLDVPLGSEVSLTPVAGENTAHAFVEGIKQNDKFKIKGNYKAGIVDPQGNVLLHLEDQGYETFYAMTDGDLLVSWFNTNEVTPELYRYIGGNEVIERFEDNETEINKLKRTTNSINGNVEGILNSYIELGFDTLYNTNVPLNNSANLPIMDFVLRGNVRQDGTPSVENPIIPIPVSGTHSLIISNGYTGANNNKEFTFHLGDIVLASSGTIQDTIQVDPNDNTRFRHYTYVGKIDSYNGETIEGEYISSTGGLDTGATIYYELPSNEATSEVITSIQLHNELKALLETNIPRGNNTLTFDDGVTTTKPHLSGIFRRVYYNVNNFVEDNDNQIPTNGAVYRAIQNVGENSYTIAGNVRWFTSGTGDITGNDLTTMDNLVQELLQHKNPNFGMTVWDGEIMVWLPYTYSATTTIDDQVDCVISGLCELNDLGVYRYVFNYTNSPNIHECTVTISQFQGGGGTADVFYTTIKQDVILNADGSSNYNFTNGNYYYLPRAYNLSYVNYNGQTIQDTNLHDCIFYYKINTSSTSNSQEIRRTDINSDPVTTISYKLFWDSRLNYWQLQTIDPYYEYVHNYHTLEHVSTVDTIPSTGGNNNVPTVGAVRNYITNTEIMKIRFGVSDATEKREAFNKLNTIWQTLNNGTPVYALLWTGSSTALITNCSSASSGGVITRYMLHILYSGASSPTVATLYTTELSDTNTWDWYN